MSSANEGPEPVKEHRPPDRESDLAAPATRIQANAPNSLDLSIAAPAEPDTESPAATSDPLLSHSDPSSATPNVASKSYRGRLAEFVNTPMAAIGGVAAVLALIPLIISGYHVMFDDDIDIQNSPISFRHGQAIALSIVVPKQLNEIDRPPNDDGRNYDAIDTWQKQIGAVFADSADVSFVARGTSDEPVLILNARVAVLERNEPLKGTWIAPDGAGSGPERILYANLDASPPIVRRATDWDFPLKVSRTDIEAFTVTASASTCHCKWQVELEILDSDGDKKKVIVNDDGKPFEITGSGAASERTYMPHSNLDSWPRR